ncbi:hypothetical protein FA13DRAFT_72987 [Coprinellus micaceus]|uniref:F-box domain-containing protein n=1 Tax=Coprinellus micaceus TaxID=71717 RepID=A0A4Y7TJ29_COPMI|nr:hypothetical protein FA13DRAFT_72987 [Coprinellus micaceus]
MSSIRVDELAAEILAHIFESQQEDSPMDDGTALLRLASVCRHWKEVAFGHPQIWTSLRGGLGVRGPNFLYRWRSPSVAGPGGPRNRSRSSSQDAPDGRAYGSTTIGYIKFFSTSGWSRLPRREGGYALRRVGRHAGLGLGVWRSTQNHTISTTPTEHDLPIRALAPRLRQFTARFSTMPYSPLFQTLDGIPLTQLSDLTLHGIEDSSQNPQFLSRFLDHAPCLENLELVHCNSNGVLDLRPFLLRHNTTLPTTHSRLQRLSLRSPVSFATRLFYSTRLPAIRVLLLDVPLNLEVVVPALDDNYHRSDFWPFLSKFSFGPLSLPPYEMEREDADLEALKKYGPLKVDFLNEAASFITLSLCSPRPRRPL